MVGGGQEEEKNVQVVHTHIISALPYCFRSVVHGFGFVWSTLYDAIICC